MAAEDIALRLLAGLGGAILGSGLMLLFWTAVVLFLDRQDRKKP